MLIFSWWRRFAPDSVANKPPALEYDIWTWQINTHVELERSLSFDLLSCYQSPPATICLRRWTHSRQTHSLPWNKRSDLRHKEGKSRRFAPNANWTADPQMDSKIPFPAVAGLHRLSVSFSLCNSNVQKTDSSGSFSVYTQLIIAKACEKNPNQYCHHFSNWNVW